MKILYSIFCFIFSFTITVYGQQQLKNIIPASPNVSEMMKYGEIPVGYFTGVPSISVPIYHIKTPGFDMPISLSYHAGGNKVESIASWVGLGWSLSSLPVITRSVNGLPDEENGGFFYKYYGKTVKQLFDEKGSADWNNFLRALRAGTADSEPDIFYYTLNGKSGKFYYDQVQEKFVTASKDNVVIEWDGAFFTITSDNGDKYTFTEREYTQRNMSSEGPRIVTAWYVTRIENATQTESILFTYDTEMQMSHQFTSFSKYVMLGGEVCSSAFDQAPDSPSSAENSESTLTTTRVEAKLIRNIHFKGGYVKFTPGSERDDLLGGHVLDSIQVYTNSNVPVMKYKLEYRYISGTEAGKNCNASDPYSFNWLFLNKVRQLSIKDESFLEHEFEYNETVPPCRTSTAQDYWGYYNGKHANTTLIPPINIPTSGNAMQFGDADRSVDPIKSQFGILSKITYPTKGWTEFDFENHEVVGNDEMPRRYITRVQPLLGEETPTSTSYDTTFVINNPPDKFLNDKNVNGGAFISVNFSIPGCDFSQGSTPCVTLMVENLDDPGKSLINFDSPFSGYYMPNGRYRMSISFNPYYDLSRTDTVDYSNFFYTVSYNELDGAYDADQSYAGGLRIKEIRSYPGGTGASPVIKRFRYTLGLDSGISSGDMLVAPHFIYSDYVGYESYCSEMEGSRYTILSRALYFRMKAYSNVQQVTHSGSYVGYAEVNVETDHPGMSGASVYKFSFERDAVSASFPYPPAVSKEALRGHLVKELHLKKTGEAYSPVKETSNQYSLGKSEEPVVYALKTGSLILSNKPELAPLPMAETYQLSRLANYHTFQQEKNYNDEDATKFTESEVSYQYDEAYNLLTSSISSAQNGAAIEKRYKYTKDFQGVPVYEALLQRNVVSPVIEESAFKGLNRTHTAKTEYAEWGTDNLLLPDKVQERYGDAPFTTQLDYQAYDRAGNPLEVKPRQGPIKSYLWGYEGSYPLAEIVNASYAQVEAAMGGAAAVQALSSSLEPSQFQLDLIASLRTKLPGALVTTYTYKPLVGMVTSTDPNGRVTSYDYDGFGRLQSVKDAGNVVKSYEYHYRGQ